MVRNILLAQISLKSLGRLHKCCCFVPERKKVSAQDPFAVLLVKWRQLLVSLCSVRFVRIEINELTLASNNLFVDTLHELWISSEQQN